MKASEPQKRTLATRTASPRLAPQAENVTKMNRRWGLVEIENQKKESITIREERVAASRINRSAKIDGWGQKKRTMAEAVRRSRREKRGRNIN